MINRKSDIVPVSRTIIKISIWPLVAILDFDVWARQNSPYISDNFINVYLYFQSFPDTKTPQAVVILNHKKQSPHYHIKCIPRQLMAWYRNENPWHQQIWASYQIRKIAGCACAGNAGNVFLRHRLQRKPLVSEPDMHHGSCVTPVPWCMSGSLTRGCGENVPGIPGACANLKCTYLARGPLYWFNSPRIVRPQHQLGE